MYHTAALEQQEEFEGNWLSWGEWSNSGNKVVRHRKCSINTKNGPLCQGNATQEGNDVYDVLCTVCNVIMENYYDILNFI